MKTTELNKVARQHIAEICEEHDWRWCHFNLDHCTNDATEPVHRHERNWYKGQAPELLWALDQWAPGCRSCHVQLDQEMSKDRREEVFKLIKGEI